MKRIIGMYNQLSNSEKLIADYFIENESEVMKSNIHELAKRIGTSSSSISRFVRKVYGKTFGETKVELALATLDNSSIPLSNQMISLADDATVIPEKLLETITKSILEVSVINPIETFEKAAKIIEKAEGVYFYGVGSSGLIASDLQQKILKLGKKCIYHYDSNFGMINSTTCTEKDVVIAFSYSGDTKEVLLPVETSKTRGSKIIVFTTVGNNNKLAKFADVALLIPPKEKVESRIVTMFSRYEQLFMVDVLFLILAKRMNISADRITSNYRKLMKKLKEK